MAYSSGTFSRLYDWTTDRDAGVKIRADRMDAEFDGIATALTTAVLKDGTQTTTATVPFAFGISVVDNKAVTLGTNSDYTIQYDETTRDSLMVTSNVEGAVFSMVLAADQGDDAGDEWKLGIADGGVLTIGNDINSAHTYVAQLTLTPNSTVASSTTAVAGNLTVGGSLTLGSGAVLSEAELEMLDGITAGTVAASKAVVVDANKDAASFRNITLTGELDAGSLDVSGDADIDGTLEADAITVGGTALNTVIAGVTVTNATTAAVATTVTITDNESTNEDNAIIFTAGGDVDGGNIGLESDGTLTYNPSTGKVTATGFIGALTGAVTGNVAGNLTGTVATATQNSITTATGLVSVGALDSGSITSGFGTIDTGSSAITTTGLISGGSLDIDDVLINGTTIGHTDDTDLMTVADGLLTVAGDVTITSTDSGSGGDPKLNLYRNSSSPADWDYLGMIEFNGRNDNSQDVRYAAIVGRASDVSDGTEDGHIEFHYINSGSQFLSYSFAKSHLYLMNENTIQWYQHGGTSYDVNLVPATPSADRTITLPDATGTVVVETSSGTVLNEGSADKDFRVESNGEENMLFVNGGTNTVGIGVSAPDALLHIASSSGFQYIERFLGGDAGGPGITFRKSRGSSQNSYTTVASSDVLGQLWFQGATGSGFNSGAMIRGIVNGTPGSGDLPTSLEFHTSPDGSATVAQRMVIFDTGYIRALGVYNQTGSGTAVVVDSDGDVMRSSSSEKYKKNIETMEDKYADAILNLRPVYYKDNPDTMKISGDADWSHWGFIAEEVEKIDPRLVHYRTTEFVDSVDSDGKKILIDGVQKQESKKLDTPVAESVHYDRIVAHLVNICKRQEDAITALTLRVKALEDA